MVESPADAESEEGRSADDVKLIASLKGKLKVLKKAYIEEEKKAETYQKQTEALLQKKSELDKALADKDALCAKLNKDVLMLQDAAIASQAKGGASPTRGGRAKSGADLELVNEALKKENEELKEKVKMLRENVEGNEKLLTDIKKDFDERVKSLAKTCEETKAKLDAAEKDRKELKVSCDKYEEQSKANFERRRYSHPAGRPSVANSRNRSTN